MPESIRTRLERLGFNLYPCYSGTGARITYISSDWREVRLALPLSLRTRNYRGTIFGGSIYAAVDPIYMLMLIKNLGKDYIVWDKSASISYLRPGRNQARAEFNLSEEDLAFIRSKLSQQDKMDWQTSVEIKDSEGTVIAKVDKVLYIRKR